MADISPRRGFDAYPISSPLPPITTHEILYLIASATSRSQIPLGAISITFNFFLPYSSLSMADISPRRGFDAYPISSPLPPITTHEILYLIASATSRSQIPLGAISITFNFFLPYSSLSMADISPRRGFDAYPMFSSLSSITTNEFLYLIASATSRFKTLPNLPFSREGAEEKCQIKSPWALLFRLKAIG
jgi:hypothetical protein